MNRRSSRVAVAVVVTPLGLLSAPTPGRAAPARQVDGQSSATMCVGLVVDATSDGGPRSSGCVHVAPGSDGLDVLEAAGHRVSLRQGSEVCSIDGVPASGCGGIDATHYWAYWHRAAGSSRWVFSSEGAGTYTPAAGATEGWIYDNGTDLTPSGVGRLCPLPKATPGTTTPTPRTTPAVTGTSNATPAATPGAGAPSAAPTARSARADRRHGDSHGRAGHGHTRPRPARSTSAASTQAGAPTTPVAPPPSVAAAAVGGGGSDTGLIAGLAIVALLGAGGIIVGRRSRR